MTEERKTNAEQIVDMIMTAIRDGTPKEVAERNMADRLDIPRAIPDVNTAGWSDEAQQYLKEIYQIVKGSSLDTRHDMKLSFPPSHYSKTDDPVSLTYEGCYKVVDYYTAIINADPELKAAFINAMAKYGINENNFDELLRREWDIWAYMLCLPEIAELTKAIPAYEDYNANTPNNYSLVSAKRKIEHTMNGEIVEKVSLETGGGTDESGNATPLEIEDTKDMAGEVTDKILLEQCLSSLSDTDREILIRHANGETYTSLAEAYGYKTAGGMQKHIEKIKKNIANHLII